MKGSELDLEQLRSEIRNLRRYHPLYKVLKEELTAIDHWKNKRRGNPQKGFRKKGTKHGKA